MNTRHTIGIVALGLALSLLAASCWQEQHHDIIPPTLPNYPVSGRGFHAAER